MTLVFVDDARARDFQPFAMTRPCCELRAGALLVRQRWEKATGEATIGFIGAPHLLDFDEAGAAQSVSGPIPAGTILVNSRCAVGLAELDLGATSWICHGKLAAVRLAEATDHASIQRDGDRLESFAGHGQAVEIEGTWLDQVWDLVRHLPALLSSDIPHVAEWTDQDPTSNLTTLGAHPVFIESGATIEPFVVLDATSGPVLVRQGAKVQSFTRLVGPCLRRPLTRPHRSLVHRLCTFGLSPRHYKGAEP